MAGNLLYVIGYPGSGKSTAIAAALSHIPVASVEYEPFAHIRYEGGLVQLGRDRDTFSGTDALSMNVQPKVVRWLKATPHPVVIAEGDRLGNNKFFHLVKAAGWALEIVHFNVPVQVAYDRSVRRGSNYNESWYRGRVSKVYRLSRLWPVITIDATQEPETLAGSLWQTKTLSRSGHPVGPPN